MTAVSDVFNHVQKRDDVEPATLRHLMNGRVVDRQTSFAGKHGGPFLFLDACNVPTSLLSHVKEDPVRTTNVEKSP